MEDKHILYVYLLSAFFAILGSSMTFGMLLKSYGGGYFLLIPIAIAGGGIPSFLLGLFVSDQLLNKINNMLQR
ncbi:hypothetical protein [Sporosarcina sp. HYO08]|uniref:hypothetical protein n=1 Tax=Sporosarcina sp. HYO08 TaxID=1759557 RepID=UPI00079AEE28|nr:hypothetical protein [Sporosarcina sp. HYO08]KXH84043.1 hypothetical protein AU377_04630 [Sporosarcina sp. HYO08]